MKKNVISLVLVACMAIGLTACGGGTGTTESKTPASSAASSAEASKTDGEKTASNGETITFKMSLVDPENSNYAEGARKIAEEVAAATDGRIQIEVMAGGVLGGERDTVELAMSGDIDIATCANSVLTNWIPEMGILDQPYLWTTIEQAHAAVDGPVGDLIEQKAEGLGLHVIGYMESGFRNTFSVNPIAKVEDFKGVKIRTMQNEYHMAAFSSFGAMPTSMGYNEVFTALQQGTINACENAVANCLTTGFYEVTKNITYTNHAYTYILCCMSDKAWNMIPDDLKEPFMEAVKRGYEAQRGYLLKANEEAVEELKKLGVSFYDIDVNELQKLYQAEAEKSGFTFDPEWQAAVDKVIADNPS